METGLCILQKFLLTNSRRVVQSDVTYADNAEPAREPSIRSTGRPPSAPGGVLGAEIELGYGGAGRSRPRQLDNRSDGRVVRETHWIFRVPKLLYFVDERMRRRKQVEDGYRHLAGDSRGTASAPASPRARGRAVKPSTAEGR